MGGAELERARSRGTNNYSHVNSWALLGCGIIIIIGNNC